MTTSDWYGLIGLTAAILTPILGGLGGAIWFAASLHSLVKSIAKDLHDYIQRNDREHEEIWDAIHTKADK